MKLIATLASACLSDPPMLFALFERVELCLRRPGVSTLIYGSICHKLVERNIWRLRRVSVSQTNKIKVLTVDHPLLRAESPRSSRYSRHDYCCRSRGWRRSTGVLLTSPSHGSQNAWNPPGESGWEGAHANPGGSPCISLNSGD